MPRVRFEEHPPIVPVLTICVIGVLGYELIIHGSEILKVLFSGMQQTSHVFWEGALQLFEALTVGVGSAAASTVVLSSIVIPVTAVSIYVLFRKAEDKPRAWIVALGLFLDPLFIDLLKDLIGKKDPATQFAVSAFGVLTFLIACSLWNKKLPTTSNPKSKGYVAARVLAIFLYLLPTICVVGLLTMSRQDTVLETLKSLKEWNIIGLCGLVLTAVVGISLSRFYEGP
jgi:hypothetical protein